jgi:hypothetical protein
MAKKVKAKKKKALSGRGLRTSAQQRGSRPPARQHKRRRPPSRTQRRAKAKVARITRAVKKALDRRPGGAKRLVKAVQKIRYGRTTTGRVRFQPIDAAKNDWSVSYASRQGARRAARRLFKPSRVVAVVPA